MPKHSFTGDLLPICRVPTVFSFTCTHRVLAANIPFSSTVHFRDLDLCQTREFLFREFFPSRSQILTVTTPRNRTTTALLKAWVALTHLYFAAKSSFVFLYEAVNNCLEIYKTSNFPFGGINFSSSCSTPNPNKEVKIDLK